ncbi:MAG: RIP metalloprotease RseP [Chromatiales bacterium]|nr:RIP metalloprotease RseP [Chromatiales bacterium]
MEFFIGALGFILALTLLVAFHEFGHYWVARRANIKVLCFAIGFGKAIYKRKFGPDDSTFVIGSIPLGGYVKMLDEREGSVADEELDRSFNRQSLAVRTMVVAAGPLANLLLAFLLYIMVFMIGSFEQRVIVGEIQPNSAAMAAGMQPGDEIYAVEGNEVRGARQTMLEILDVALGSDTITLEVATATGERRLHTLKIDSKTFLNDDSRSAYEKLGIIMMLPELEAIVGRVLSDSAAERYGLMENDKITHFNGLPIRNWRHLTQQIRSHPDASVVLTILRGEQEMTMNFRPDTREQGDRLIGVAGIVAYSSPSLLDKYQVHIRYGLFDSIIKAADQTWTITMLTFKFIGSMITGSVSLSNISGPVTIAEVAGVSFLMGIVSYLSVLAIISISIGVLNLLPVPMLDGGHLLHYLWEFIAGKPLSMIAQLRAQYVGMVMIGSLIALALYNDMQRLFGF